MKLAHTAPRVAFVIQLQTQGTATDVARIQHVVHLFRGHRIPCTWSVAGCCSLESIQHKGILQSTDNLALTFGHENSTAQSSSGLFRDTLRKRLAAMRACSGAEIHLVAGDPTTLRSHAAILAEQGIRAVLSSSEQQSLSSSHSPLPCGLWQMNFGAMIPRRSWLARFVAGNQSVLRQVTKLSALDQPLLVSIDASAVAHTSARSLQQLDKLLQSISLCASRQQVNVVTVGEIVVELSAGRVSRPQQSILRAA
ncbi:hypothetical protein [Bythopirellula polymerisocia]|uniref:Uncharacterized protein n=1 Tax=Bythopirellula polymerisocia TaxID=2528003 RepID=A0A5C6CHE2_9BACT|nr:hypothetical protein [Bythopirellula polymerisocia]TWU23778.1 hypothetical protein Pla144_39530 [Bythopirellula polymerisocia]